MDKDNWRDREKKRDRQESRQLERDLCPIDRGWGGGERDQTATKFSKPSESTADLNYINTKRMLKFHTTPIPPLLAAFSGKI